MLETLVDAVLQTLTLFTTPKMCRLTTRFKTWPLKSIHFLRTKVNITSCSKVNGSEHQLKNGSDSRWVIISWFPISFCRLYLVKKYTRLKDYKGQETKPFGTAHNRTYREVPPDTSSKWKVSNYRCNQSFEVPCCYEGTLKNSAKWSEYDPFCFSYMRGNSSKCVFIYCFCFFS